LSKSDNLKPLTVAAVAIMLAVASCIFSAALWWRVKQSTDGARSENRNADYSSTTTSSTPHTDYWLKGTTDEKLNQIEVQLRGLDKTMVEVGYRFTELYLAGKEHNWDYAKYQAEKMDLAIRLGLERRPKRAASAQSFLKDEIPMVLKAIESKDDQIFQSAMERLRSSCVKCHNLEQVPYFTVEFPERHLAPMRNTP
jgi:hypothetical protein